MASQSVAVETAISQVLGQPGSPPSSPPRAIVTLADLIPRMNRSELALRVRQVCQEVARLHHFGWVHGNLQANSFRWDREKNTLKLTGYNQGRNIMYEPVIAPTRPAYPESHRAPELWLSRTPGEPTLATDRWALGCLLVHMMTRSLPFSRQLTGDYLGDIYLQVIRHKIMAVWPQYEKYRSCALPLAAHLNSHSDKAGFCPMLVEVILHLLRYGPETRTPVHLLSQLEYFQRGDEINLGDGPLDKLAILCHYSSPLVARTSRRRELYDYLSRQYCPESRMFYLAVDVMDLSKDEPFRLPNQWPHRTLVYDFYRYWGGTNLSLLYRVMEEPACRSVSAYQLAQRLLQAPPGVNLTHFFQSLTEPIPATEHKSTQLSYGWAALGLTVFFFLFFVYLLF